MESNHFDERNKPSARQTSNRYNNAVTKTPIKDVREIKAKDTQQRLPQGKERYMVNLNSTAEKDSLSTFNIPECINASGGPGPSDSKNRKSRKERVLSKTTMNSPEKPCNIEEPIKYSDIKNQDLNIHMSNLIIPVDDSIEEEDDQLPSMPSLPMPEESLPISHLRIMSDELKTVAQEDTAEKQEFQESLSSPMKSKSSFDPMCEA